jgi:hypothetical protein
MEKTENRWFGWIGDFGRRGRPCLWEMVPPAPTPNSFRLCVSAGSGQDAASFPIEPESK